MSRTTKTAALFLALAALASTGAESADNALQASGSTFRSNGKVIAPVHYKGGLQTLVKFSELFIVPGTIRRDRVLVLVRQPTRHLGMHRCGAGHEDFLVLVRFHGGAVTLLDKVPLQSCENTFELDLPDFTDPDAVVSAIKVAGDQVSFSVIAPNREGNDSALETRRYRLVEDRFVEQ